MDIIQFGIIGVIKTTSQVLTAGIAITAFSLLLYSFSFNLHDRVVRSFILIFGQRGVRLYDGSPADDRRAGLGNGDMAKIAMGGDCLAPGFLYRFF